MSSRPRVRSGMRPAGRLRVAGSTLGIAADRLGAGLEPERSTISGRSLGPEHTEIGRERRAVRSDHRRAVLLEGSADARRVAPETHAGVKGAVGVA